MKSPFPSRLAALGVVAMVLAACQREEPVRVYEVIVPPATREASAPPAERGPMPAMPKAGAAVSAQASLAWTVPPGWEAQPLSPMTNRGHYLLPESGGARPVVTVSSYTGPAGGLAANLNRWRGQLGLAPQPDAEAEKSMDSLTVGSFTLRTVLIEGAKPDGTPAAMAGAVLMLPEETWFFKLTGPKAAVEAARPAFDTVLQSIKKAVAPQAGASAPESGPVSPPAPTTPKPKFTLPAGWTEKPASGMRAASFAIPGPEGMDTDISVVRLSGDAGGDLQNVNLWRSQLGLPEIAAAEMPGQLKTEKIGETEFRIFDATTPAPIPQTSFHGRILAALVTKGADTWVVRARGEAKQIETEQPNLRAFLASLRLP